MLIFRFYRNLHLRIVHHQLFGEQMLCGPCNNVGNCWIISPSNFKGWKLTSWKVLLFWSFLSREISHVYIYHNATCMRKMKYISTDVSTKTANVDVTSTFSVPTNQTAELRNDKKTYGKLHLGFSLGKKNSKKTCGWKFWGFPGKWWVYPTNLLVFLLKMIILGWRLGVTPFKETPI